MQFDVHAALFATSQTAPLVAWPPYFNRRLLAGRRAFMKVASNITVFGTAASEASDECILAATAQNLKRLAKLAPA